MVVLPLKSKDNIYDGKNKQNTLSRAKKINN